jgi:tRNA-2-methylthio-N6-dimethylallyladenosine synthase
MLARLEAGETRITGLDDRQTNETFETEFTSRTNPHRGYITIIEGLRQVLRVLRGAVYARQGAVADFGFGARRGAADGRCGFHGDSTAGAERELVSTILRQDVVCGAAGCGGRGAGDSAGAVYDVASADFTKDIVEAIDAVPTLCDHVHLPVQSGSSDVLKAMAREYTREWYLERMSWIKAAKREISMTSDMIVGFPGETEADFEETATLLSEVGTTLSCVQVLAAAEYTGDHDGRFDSEEVKSERLKRLMDLSARFSGSTTSGIWADDGGDGRGP